MTSAISRIRNEINRMKFPYIRSVEHRENPLHLDIICKGPKGTKYVSTEFHILLQYPVDYPYRPPTLTFVGDTQNETVASPRLKLLDPSIWQIAFQLQDIMEGIHYMLKIQTDWIE